MTMRAAGQALRRARRMRRRVGDGGGGDGDGDGDGEDGADDRTASGAAPAFALDKVTFGTNWLADPEAGGYYQALVDGTFEKYGLDVKILPGGPMSNGGLLLISGKEAGRSAVLWPLVGARAASTLLMFSIVAFSPRDPNRLRPAMGPDGKPATVREIVEVAFQLF